MDTLSISEAASFRACSRKHHYYYRERRRPIKKPDTLTFGAYVHEGLEIFLTKGLGDLSVWMLKHELSFDLAKAQAMLLFYSAMPLPFSVVAVEEEFRLPLVNPDTGHAATSRVLVGKYDGIIRQGGKTFVLEHKTSSEDVMPGSQFWVRLRMAAQPSLYLKAARQKYGNVDGVLYNVLKKPTIRPLKANKRRSVDETPEEYRARCAAQLAEDPGKFQQYGTVVRMPEEMSEADQDLWMTHKMIQMTSKMDIPPRNPGACNDYHRLCEYFNVCTGCCSLSDESVFYTAEKKHQELELEV